MTRESVIRMQDRHFTTPVDEIFGTVDEVSAGGITLNEYPGRLFQFSTVSTSAADMSARILGENNNMTRSFHPAAAKRPRARTLDRSCANASTHPRSGPRPVLATMLLKAGKLAWFSSFCPTKVLIASTLAAVLCSQGFEASFFTESLQALQSARYYAPDLLISEVSMPVLSGIDLAIQVQKHRPKCKVLLFSGRPDITDLLKTSRANGDNFEVLPKPIHPDELLAKIQSTLGLASLPKCA
jgi:CheY-like chemotaxis protein